MFPKNKKNQKTDFMKLKLFVKIQSKKSKKNKYKKKHENLHCDKTKIATKLKSLYRNKNAKTRIVIKFKNSNGNNLQTQILTTQFLTKLKTVF